MKPIILIVLLTSLSLQAQQEKRLALIIANGDYEHYSELKNPINDAELISQKLDSLGFEVMKGYNLEYKAEFLDVIDEFGARRERDSFDVAIVYYAGHAIQVENENYLLPTKEFLDFNQGKQLDRKAVKVSEITYWLERKPDQFNILILDACRNNPIPAGTATRNIIQMGDGGLAEIDDISGTLIAFAAKAGKTALDGSGANSPYAISLSRNMMLENTSINQVLRNVRAEVQQQTDKAQSPDYTDRSTWKQEFYFNKGNYFNDFKNIDSLIEAKDFDKSLALTLRILNQDPQNIEALILKAQIYAYLKRHATAKELFNKVVKQNPNNIQSLLARSEYFLEQNQVELALRDITQAKRLDPENELALLLEWSCHLYNGNCEQALVAADSIDGYLKYMLKASIYSDCMHDYDSALVEITQALMIEPNDPDLLRSRATINTQLNQNENAIKDLEIILQNESLKNKEVYVQALNNIGLIYMNEGEFDAAMHYFDSVTKYEQTFPYIVSRAYHNRFAIKLLEEDATCLEEIGKAITLDPNNPAFYVKRADYLGLISDFELALKDINKAFSIGFNLNVMDQSTFSVLHSVDFKSIEHLALQIRGRLYFNNEMYEEAFYDYREISIKFPSDMDAVNAMGVIAEAMGNQKIALESYQLCIDNFKESPIDAAYCYINRGIYYQENSQYKNAESDFDKAVSLMPDSAWIYNNRAHFYYEIGQIKNARKDLNKALSLDPQNAETYEIMGDFESYQAYEYQEYLNAITQYEKAVGLHKVQKDSSSIAYCLQGIASCYLELDSLEKSLSFCNEAIGFDPNSTEAFVSRSITYDYLDEFQLALKDINQTIRIAPENSYNYFEKGNLQYRNQYFKEALKEFRYCHEQDSLEVDYLNMLVLTLNKLGKYDEALKHLENYLDFSNLNLDQLVEALRVKGSLYAAMGQHDLSVRSFTEALLLDINDETRAWLLFLRGKVLMKTESYDSAKNNFERAIKLYPDYPECIASLCYATYALNNTEEAFKIVSKHIKRYPESRLFYYCRSKFFMDQNNFEAAKQDILRTIEMDKKDPEGYYFLALLNFRNKKYFQAVRNFNKALLGIGGRMDYYIANTDGDRIPTSQVIIKRSKVYEVVGDFELACEDYKKALELMIDEPFYLNKEADLKALEEKINEYCQN